jgi:hypothetical protein
MIAMMIYALHVVSSLSGALAPVPASSCDRRITKPALVTIARNGAVAGIIPTYPGDEDSGGRRIVVRRPDGSLVELKPPSDAILAQHFRMKDETVAEPRFQDVYFRSVRLEDDGTPVATVVSHFWGAYSGIETSAYRWNGVGWKLTPPYNVMPPAVPDWEVNTEVGAVATIGSAAFNGVYGHQWIPDTGFINDPNYQRNEVERRIGDRVVALGPGTATAIRGTTLVGFAAGLNPFGPSCERPRASFAVEWSGNNVAHRVGPGIAYDVNASGDIVGDNERRFGEMGQPMLWHNGHGIVLDQRRGSAYGIADDGTIVGQVGHDAFIADAGRPHAAIHLLDRQLADHNWHVTAAYGIGTRGQILAAAGQGSGPQQIVVLDPER